MVIYPKNVNDACMELFAEIWSLQPGLKDKAALTVITSLAAYIEEINQKSSASSDRNQAESPSIERRDDDVQITLAAQIFGPLTVLCLDSSEKVVVKPAEIRLFLRVCRGISHSDLARGLPQDGLISQTNWQSWVKSWTRKVERDDLLRKTKKLNDDIEKRNKLIQSNLADLERELADFNQQMERGTENG